MIQIASGRKIFIRFKNQALTNLRKTLLRDLSKEHYAVLLAKRQQAGDITVFTVVEIRIPGEDWYKSQHGAGLTLDGKFVGDVLSEIDQRVDVDSVIECHTHPFSQRNAWFSAGDDRNESDFVKWLHKIEPNRHYVSIVFTQTEYKARSWEMDKNGCPFHTPALIRTQKISEQIKSPDDTEDSPEIGEMFQRSVAALGLDAMRKMTCQQKVSVIGVGGVGSIIAEHLIHLGIPYVNLIDYDKLELTNMNRIVGACYEDAKQKRLKVECIKKHLQLINPKAVINAYPINVFDKEIESIIAESNWIFIATDTHASRYQIQNMAFKYFVPFITGGSKIEVKGDSIKSISGEVILVRMGDEICLRCLGKIKFDEVAKEIHPDEMVRHGLIAGGYVSGFDVKEPSVKTLNTHIATLAVDVFVNQFTERRRDAVITVYEDNYRPKIYEDRETVKKRRVPCSICGE